MNPARDGGDARFTDCSIGAYHVQKHVHKRGSYQKNVER